MSGKTLCVLLFLFAAIHTLYFFIEQREYSKKSLCPFVEDLVGSEHPKYEIYIVMSSPSFFFAKGSIEEIAQLLHNTSFVNGNLFSAFSCPRIFDDPCESFKASGRVLVIYEPNHWRTIKQFRTMLGSLNENYPGLRSVLYTGFNYEPLPEILFYRNVDIVEFSPYREELFRIMHIKNNEHAPIELFSLAAEDTEELTTAECAIQYKLPSELEEFNLTSISSLYWIDSGNPKKNVCLLINVWPEAEGGLTTRLSLFLKTLQSVLDTKTEEEDNLFDVMIYFGLSYGDSIFSRADIDSWINLELSIFKSGKHIGFQLVNLPLFRSSMNVVFKYNTLAQKAYNSGCQYIFQVNDGTEFLTPGWIKPMVEQIDSGMKAVTLQDLGWLLNETDTSLQIMVNREHIKKFNSLWPQQMKNYYVEQWIPRIYGPNFGVVKGFDLKPGSFYKNEFGCNHKQLLDKLVAEASSQ